MASANSVDSEEQLRCSICLDVFTDPVTTPCGHNYCNTCITKYWDGTDVYNCPLCKETFDERPRFSVNKVLSEMADQSRKQLKQTSSASKEPEVSCEEASKPEEVFCAYCNETKVKARKSCLTCLKSLCAHHLSRHDFITEFRPHITMSPVKKPKNYVCRKHDDTPLELFCKTDQVPICEFCVELGHKSHQIVSLEEECEGKKDELGKTAAEVKRMIQERHKKIQEVQLSTELSKKAADREIAESAQVFTSLISCIEKSQAELIDVIEKKQKTTEKQAEDLIKDLHQEINELKKRSSELKQLSSADYHLFHRQNFTSINTIPPTKDWTNVKVHQSYVGTVRTAVAQLEKTLSQEMEKLSDELGRIQQYAMDVTLDPDTAHPYLVLSEDGKQVYDGNVKKNLPDNTVRFTAWLSVSGKQCFSSGRSYYEVQVKDKSEWYLGVARESVNRKEGITSNGYWTLRLENGNKCHALADPVVSIPVREKLQKVGVFVDYEEGLVSFHDVEARVHLYSFTGCTFTENLYPFFNVGKYCQGKNCAPLIITPVNLAD